MSEDFSTSTQEEELSALENEISQAEASLEQDFASFAAEKLASDETLEELFFEDKEGFILQILQMQNDFLNEGLRAKMQRADTLKSDIEGKKQMQGIEAAQKEFLEAHPDADMAALMEFYEEELGAKYKKELDKLEPKDFFTTLYEIYQMRNKKGDEEEHLPRELEANEADASVSSVGSEDMPMNRL
ncbi:Coiled-coil domain-containing protein [Campylobacter vulpis]|uniref:Coiled-coil domain-containing protein n=1 Tax=Campylobacter vulpis TaxID=1655500 RepID=UPI001BCF82B5|nr:Coiled-coil domain-containing protein [Campylobacter vulpis]MBS4407342.1 Coiled-coil domain-containing protein [Campylobacter vulpis]